MAHNQRPNAKNLVDVSNHFTSLTIKDYNMKGDAASLRSKLDESKKQDLIRNHFNIGGPTANYKNTSAALSYRPAT